MSNKFYPKAAHFERKHQVCPNSLVFHRGMSDASKVLILALNGIATNAPGWTPVQCDLRKRLGWGREKMQNAIKDCVKFGYLIVKQSRLEATSENGKKGQFKHNEFEFDIDGGYIGSQQAVAIIDTDSTPPTPKTGFQVPDSQVPENQSIPMPSMPILDIPKGNAPYPQMNKPKGNDKAMPFHSKDSGNGKAAIIPSATRKFKRKQDHQERFEYLMSLSLTDKDGRVSEDEMSYLSHTHSMQKLQDTFAHMQFKIQEGKQPRCRVAFFKHLLNSEHNPRGSKSDANAEYAKQFAKEMGWNSLRINDKYVDDPALEGKELPLNMDSMCFFASLVEMFHSINGR